MMPEHFQKLAVIGRQVSFFLKSSSIKEGIFNTHTFIVTLKIVPDDTVFEKQI